MIQPVSPDKNVEAVRDKLLLRSQIGLRKYGVTTERKDIDLAGWLKHLQEELLDAAVYVEANLRRLQATQAAQVPSPSTPLPDPQQPKAGSTSTPPVQSYPLEEFLGR